MDFWKNHGDRIVFMIIALALAGLIHKLGMHEEAKVIFIGLAMLAYNKARGSQEKK